MGDDPPLDGFISTLRRSRLFDPADLDRLPARFRPASARALADALVGAGELTHYQADKLLRGRWQGLVIGPYSVLAPLGRGGMGTVVYLARDRRAAGALGDAELLALKLLPDRKAAENPLVLRRFRREMEIGRRVDHPRVVRTFAAGDLDDVHYIALEYVPGRTLTQAVAAGGPLPLGDAARVFADVAEGLTHVHARGLVHRDVKPGNVMVRPDGRAVVLDLGLAIAPGDPAREDPLVVGGKGYMVGTMDFLAPEQARHSTQVVPATDLYGLGCTFYYALTGAVPFPAPDTKAKVRRHRHDPPPAVPGAPPEVNRLLQSLMAKAPADRPPSAAKVRELLLPWAAETKRPAAVDAVAAADEQGLDVELWEAAPGDDLPVAEAFVHEANPFARLDDDSAAAPATRPPGAAGGWLLLAGVAALTGLVLLVGLLRRL